MFVVTIDIWPHGRFPAKYPQVRIAGANVGCNEARTRADYEAWDVTHLDSDLEILRWVTRRPAQARVVDFPRSDEQSHLPALACALIEALGLTEIAVAPTQAHFYGED